MTKYDELRLQVYESCGGTDVCDTILTALESCQTKSEFMETAQDVYEILDYMQESGMYEEGYYMEAPKFKLLPSFKSLAKKYPGLEGYQDLIREADTLAAECGYDMKKTTGQTIIRWIAKVFKVWYNLGSVILAPFTILIVPIIPYLMNRLIVWGAEFLEYKMVEQEIDNAKNELRRIRTKATDEATKKRLDRVIAQLDKKSDALHMQKMSSKENEKTVREFAEENAREYIDVISQVNFGTLVLEWCQ